uniref:Testis expressed 15, meiosis and synapsis associated n=2 Tax=Saimiri boliviensis boliviensis TaxID=39432 RepID=A0A2K6TNS2_SAIBB
MATNKMEMKETAKQNTLWQMISTSEPLLNTGEVNPLKKFTIPKIRRTAGKVYLSACCTNSREYSFIHDTLNQGRLDVSCDLQSLWQFGDTKLIHNEELEKNFTAKRSEMRESGRHCRELEEHFCFLALPQSDVAEIYQNGISTRASTLKILGSPLLGIYMFRHVDIALNYSHSRNITVESILIFKVLFGKVKKIQPSMDKNKVSLDPSPNFDCHMSRNAPSLKDTIEVQAYSSAVYFYEYSFLSKPVDKPRQCLPYAVVTVKFIGSKVDNGYLTTSSRFLSTGFPKRAERTCSLNNCTVAKRIGKGKDATVIFEHFKKPVDPFVQENCLYSAPNSEINHSNSSISNSCGNVQNGNISISETYSGQTEQNLVEIRDTSQVLAHDSDISVTPSDANASVNGDFVLNWTSLKNILSSLNAAFPLHNNTGSSTVTTSKFIKDPRLMRREESTGGQSNSAGLNEILQFEKSLDYVNSEINLSSTQSNSASSSEVVTGDRAVFTNCLDAPCFNISVDDSQSWARNIGSEDYDCIPPDKVTMAGQCKDRGNFSFPISVSNVVSEVKNQNYSEEKVQSAQQESVNAYTKEYNSHISQESQSSNLKTIYQTGYQMPTILPLQKKVSIDEYLQNTGKMKNFTDLEDNSKHEEKQTSRKKIENDFTNETKINPIDNYIVLHQEYKESESHNYFGKSCDKTLITQELEIPKSSTSTIKDKDELYHPALKWQVTPSLESLSQKYPQHFVENENNIDTNLAIAQKLMELKLGKINQNCASIITEDFQKPKDVPQAKETLIDKVISSYNIETAHDDSNCNITREHVCICRKNENEPVSLENSQRDYKETAYVEDTGQDHSLFCNSQLNNNICLNVNFKEQRDNYKENQNEAKENNALSEENNLENIYGDEKPGSHTNENFSIVDEKEEKKNYNIEILSSEEFSTTFNLICREKYVSPETAFLESEEDTISAMKQKDTENTGRRIEHLASTTFPEIASSSVCVASNAAVQIASATIPALSTNNEDDQIYQFKETYSESSDFGLLVKHRVSGGEIDMDKNKLQESFHRSINENLVLQSIELESEIEIGLEDCDDAFVFQLDTHSHENMPCEEFVTSYKALKSRITWEGLLALDNGEIEVLECTTGRENSDQHYSKESNHFYSSAQNNETDLPSPILLPDLQIRITNIFRPGFSPTADSLALKDNFCTHTVAATKLEINKEDEETLGFGIYSKPSGENTDYPCEDKVGNIRQESALVSKAEISLSFDWSNNTDVNHTSENQNSESLFTEPSNVTAIDDGSGSFSTKSKTVYNDTKNKKEVESRSNKRKLYTSSEDQNIAHKDLRWHEICGKKRRQTSQDSSECFSSLSQGRIKTFSQLEKHIKSVLDILRGEASLCKSKRLSRKLDKAVIHLKKAHRRVHTSLQLIAKVGEKGRGPLPRSYAIICNNFWESCDLQGYSSVSQRRYYSTKHFLSKRKYDKQRKKRALKTDISKSLTHVSKYKSYKTSRVKKCLSRKSMASSVSKTHPIIHMGEFSNQEHPELQLPVSSTSQITSQSVYYNSSVSNPSLSEEHQLSSGKTRSLFSPHHSDEKLIEKENQIDTEFLSSISKYEKLENHSANHKDATKENSCQINEVINESNSVSSSCIRENNIDYSTGNDYDATCIDHTKVKTDVLISVLDSNMEHFLNADLYQQNNLTLSDCKRNLEVNFPVEKCTVPIERSKQNIITGNFLMDPLNLTLIASKKYIIPQLLSAAAVTDSEGESSVSYLDKQRILTIDSFAASTTISNCEQSCRGKVLLKTEQCSSGNCLHTNGNETNVTENYELDVTSVTEESKSYGENVVKLSSSDSSLLLKDNVKGSSSETCTVKKDTENRIMQKVKQVEKAKDSVYKSMTEGSTVKTEYKNRKNQMSEESCLNEKMIKTNLIDSHLSTENTTTESFSLKNTVSNPRNKREKKGEIKVSNVSQSDLTLHSEIACISKPEILGVNHMPVLPAHSKTCKVTTFLKKPTSYVSGFKDKHSSANHTALIPQLSQILQRADEASSLQILQEETKVCLNILPLFVEAFERKQECSVEQILISRELLVGQNLWNNWKHILKPCAIDTLVELQMMMETIQFIENKKRRLEGKPTFRSLLWYDETLYAELLGKPRGFQQQSNFYPGFQGRLKYDAFCELQTYHDQLVELLEETKRENNSYYAFLKYKRQVNECEAIMKHCSDCFDFSLSVPFACGVNFGDSLEDLEILRKSTLKLISVHGDSPKVHSYPGKQDHLWIIIEIISSKINFIKNNEVVGIKISLYGLEHIFFDAAKNLVWKERGQSFSKNPPKKDEEGLLTVNKHAFSKLQKIYDTLSKDLNNEPISSMGLEDTVIASRNHPINKATSTIEDCKFNSTLLAHPDICCISEILDQAEFADLKKLQDLTLRCTDHLEILKKYFQMLQDDNIDNIFITEENVLGTVKNHSHAAIILKPEAIEMYIEIVMVSETIHFLKNSIAKKLDKQRFRGMLWFDLSLLPELVQCQEKMASFSFLKENSTDVCLWKVIETAISELKKDLDIIYKYNEAVNCSYALHLISRELQELSEIKKLLKKSEYPTSTYIEFVPYIASINYGSTITELEYNYNQFSTLLKNIMSAPRKDLGKMAHIMKVMKTIEHMKIICAKNAELTISFILCQMLYNRRKILQLKRKEKLVIHVVKPEENISKSSISVMIPPVSECLIKNISKSSKQRPGSADKCEDSQEQQENTVSSCKKLKLDMKDVTKISREKATFKHPRTTGSHPQSEKKIVSSSSNNLKRNHLTPKKVEMQRSLPGSLLENPKDTCTSKSESKIDLTVSERFTGQQENLTSMKKTNVNFSAAETKSDNKDCAAFVICDQKSVYGTFSPDHETVMQKFLKNSPDPTQKSCLSDINPGTDVSLVPDTSVLSKPITCFEKDSHIDSEMNDRVFKLQDNDIVNSSIKNSTCMTSPEPIFIQNKIPTLQINELQPAETESEDKYMKDTLNPNTVHTFGGSGHITVNVNQTAEYSFSEQQNGENSKVLTQNATTYWNELPQSACTPVYNSSENLFGTSYPYYSWYVYHYSSSNGNAITQTYQGITSYEVQPSSSGLLTTVANTTQSTHSNLLYSQYFTYFAREPQANNFVPVNGYCQSQIPAAYNFQQPIFPQYSHQPLPQATYPYLPNLDVPPEDPWTYTPWHQQSFHPGH